MNEMLPDTISNGILFNVSALPKCERKRYNRYLILMTFQLLCFLKMYICAYGIIIVVFNFSEIVIVV